MTAASIARALGGHRNGDGYLCRCPVLGHGQGRGDRRPSLSVHDGDERLLVRCFAGCDPRDVLAELRRRGLLDDGGDHVERRHHDHRERREPPHEADEDKDAERTALALAIWREAGDPREELVDLYLRQRGLRLTNEIANAAIRYHPRCPFKGQRVPCMVALVRDVITNEPRAIHRTALTAGGHKAVVEGVSRLSLGPVGGGAVKLTPDEHVTLCLGIGEGIESTLSMRLAHEFGNSPVWALLSAGQLGVFPVLSGIEALWIAVDNDVSGIKSAQDCAARWREVGPEVFLVKPRAKGTDLNDLARSRHA